MRNKNAWKKSLSLFLAGIMTVSTPMTAFASESLSAESGYTEEIVFVDEEAPSAEEIFEGTETGTDASENELLLDVSEELPEAEAPELVAENEEAPVLVPENGDALILAVENVDAPVLAGAADDDELEEKKAAAKKFIEDNYLAAGKRLISNGGDGIVQNGAQIEVGLKPSNSSSKINSINFASSLYAASNAGYKYGIFLPKEDEHLSYKKPTVRNSRSIKKRDAVPYSFNAVLKLYENTVADDDINADTAAALAEQTFVITLLPEAVQYQVRFAVLDSVTNTAITNAAVTVSSSSSVYDVVNPKDGVYTLEGGRNYLVDLKADGYKSVSGQSVTATENGTISLTMVPLTYHRFTLAAKDADGSALTDASVRVTDKKGYGVSPESDGSYRLIEGESYTYTVSATGYEEKRVSFTSDKDESIEVTLDRRISVYQASFQVQSAVDQTAVAAPEISVTYEEYDDSNEQYNTETVRPNADGSYRLTKGIRYDWKVSADGFVEKTGSYTPSGNSEQVTIPVLLDKVPVSAEDKAKVEAVKNKFFRELGVLRPYCGTDTNICTMVQEKIAGYTDLDTEGVTVSLKKTENPDYIAADGTIRFVTADSIGVLGVNSENVSVTFLFRCRGAEAEAARTVTVGWDVDHFEKKMKAEAEQLTWDSIRGSNTDTADVAADLTLPRCMGSSVRSVWSEISWSSDSSVIELKKGSLDSIIYPMTGVVHPAQEDTKVTLTATFKPNDGVLNSNVDKALAPGSTQKTFTRTFEVTVKGVKAAKPTEEELQALLDKYYSAADLKDFASGEKLDAENCTGDIQLLRYTKVKDSEDHLVFNNKEITVASENEAVITINSYKAVVDHLVSDKDITVNLIVTFTRDGVTVSKKIPVVVKPMSAELDAEIALMEQAKAHYFDALNNGVYEDQNSITGNLHAFQEMYLDESGKLTYVYNVNDKKGNGIIIDDQKDDPWEMEGAGYNKFKSSNFGIIAHENLVVTRPEKDTKVTISSLLSSERFRESAKKHPDNEKLQKLYKQPVTVTVTVRGTKGGEEAPAQEAAEMASIVLTANEKSNVAGTRMPLNVSSDTARNYGYTKKEGMENKVTAMDAIIAYHAAAYADFSADPQKYLKLSGGFVSRIFGIDTANTMFFINNQMPGSATWDQALLTENDKMQVFLMGDIPEDPNDWANHYKDQYLYFEQLPEKATDADSISLKLVGYGAMAYPQEITPAAGSVVSFTEQTTKKEVTAVVNEKGMANTKLPAGTYAVTVKSAPYAFFIAPAALLKVTEHTHIYDSWQKKTDATVFAKQTEQHACTLCHKSETRAVGDKLTPKMTLNVTKLPLKVKQTTTKVKVSGLANGDSVASWKSSNKKIVSVNSQGKLTAGKKTGKATITVTLKSGLKKNFQVTVQKGAVKTTKISNLPKNLTLKKGAKNTLKPILAPITSVEKVTYRSSNSRVLSVSKKGVLTAKKAGTATITVKAGKKQFKIKVKVTK